MIPERPSLERRVLAALDASPARVPVLLGDCGTGRTSVLLRLRTQLGRSNAQYIDVERTATTPERFLRALTDATPFPVQPHMHTPANGGTARDGFDATLAFFCTARTPAGGAATFLLDEVLEFRTFESFPGLRNVLRDLVDALAGSPNRFVLTSRYVARTHRLLRDGSAQFEVIHVPPLGYGDVRAALGTRAPDETGHLDDLLRAALTLGEGRPSYVLPLIETALTMTARGGGDAVSALTAQLVPGGEIANACRFRYELRLHRARGYGALKAILEVLGEEEPLTLTEIAQRLRRTPGSTKDYLSWLEDVDLITARQKRYSFSDPLLRTWVRLHCRPAPPSDDDVAREVQVYAAARLPRPEPAMVMAGGQLIEMD